MSGLILFPPEEMASFFKYRVPVVSQRFPGMRGAPAKPEPFHIRATVVWAKGHEFEVNLHTLRVVDMRWLTGFLAEAHGQSLLSQAA